MCNVSSMVPWVVHPFIDCMQIKLSDGFQQFFFFEPYNFMGRTTWEFVRLFVNILQEDHVEKPLNHLWRNYVNVQWQKVYYSSAKKMYQTDGFFKKPFLSKTDFKTNYGFKIRVWFCWMNLWECFNPLIHNVPKWSDTL